MVKRLFTLAVLLTSMLVASATTTGDVNGDAMRVKGTILC